MSLLDYFFNRRFVRSRASFSRSHNNKYVLLCDFTLRFNAQNRRLWDMIPIFKAIHWIEIEVNHRLFNQNKYKYLFNNYILINSKLITYHILRKQINIQKVSHVYLLSWILLEHAGRTAGSFEYCNVIVVHLQHRITFKGHDFDEHICNRNIPHPPFLIISHFI